MPYKWMLSASCFADMQGKKYVHSTVKSLQEPAALFVQPLEISTLAECSSKFRALDRERMSSVIMAHQSSISQKQRWNSPLTGL